MEPVTPDQLAAWMRAGAPADYSRKRARDALRLVEGFSCGSGSVDVHQVTYDPKEDACVVVAHVRSPELEIDKLVVIIVNKYLRFKEVWPDQKAGWSENPRSSR